MMDRLKQLQARLLEWWNKFTSKQKTILVGIVAVVVFTFAILIYTFSRPQYTRFYTGSTTSDTATVYDLLQDAGLTVRLSTDGLRIDVLKGQENMANYTMGSAGYTTGASGYESGLKLSDVLSGGFSTTESDKQKLYVDYLQRELEANFGTYDAVRSAKVEIHIPNQDGTIARQTQEASCYIRLELSGPFTSENAATMAKAAAARLGNSTTASIIITDTAANLLFDGAEDYSTSGQAHSLLELNSQAESYIKSKVTSALIATGQFDFVEVASHLTFDYSEYEQTDHIYTLPDGQDTGLITHQTTAETDSESGGGGVPGTDSNGENNENTYLWSTGTNVSSSSSETDTDYVVNERILSSAKPAGIIDYDSSSITVTAISYNVVREENVRDQGLLDGGITWDQYKYNNDVATRIEVDDDFYSAVATATGIAIENITIIAYRENLFYDAESASANWTDILSIFMIIVILALLAFVIFRSMQTKKEVEPEEELSVETLLQSTPETELEDIEVETKSETRKMIDKFVEENPEAVANLLRNWLNESWG